MNWNDFETAFSPARVGRYKSRYRSDESQAMTAYLHNLWISESLTPFFSTVEIALRNSMHRQLGIHFGRADWWDSWAGNRAYQGQFDRVQAAYSKLRRRREPATADKVVAELTFGFWATLLNVEFQHSLWSPLRKAFPHCPKPERQRRTISAHVNALRDVRNRAFHHEPVLWLAPDVDTVYTNGVKLVSWIHGPLETWLVNLTRVRAAWTDWKHAEAGFAVRNARKSAPHAT